MYLNEKLLYIYHVLLNLCGAKRLVFLMKEPLSTTLDFRLNSINRELLYIYIYIWTIHSNFEIASRESIFRPFINIYLRIRLEIN